MSTRRCCPPERVETSCVRCSLRPTTSIASRTAVRCSGARARHGAHHEQDFRVTLADTGLDTMTGGRVLRVQRHLGEDDDTFMVTYGDGVGQAQSDQVSETLMTMDGVGSYSYIGTIRDTFTNSMNAINYAVIIIIVAAAALAFVVLYNLTNINITERMRELATLKVLGFYDREVSAYVYRENIFLTLFGIAMGLVMGRFLHGWLVTTVEVDIAMFGRTAPAYAYVIAAALTVVFSALVNVAAHFRLKMVDMVVSLKTVE